MPLSDVHGILADLLAAHGGSSTLPQSLAQACVAALPVDGVGLALINEEGHQGMIAATDGPAQAMEDLQFTVGEGPCLDASRSRSPVLQPDLARTGPAMWPGFTPDALEAGISAIFAFPLNVGGIRLGVLDLYRSSTGSLDSDELRQALAYADAAVVMLLHLQNQVGPEEGLHPDLADALGRPEIHQATGIIAVQAVVGLGEALLLLRGHAFAAERPILEIALDVVGRRLRFKPEDDHHE